MGCIESDNGVHKKEKLQGDPNKTVGERYAEHHKLDWSKCDGDKPHEIKNRTIVIENSDDGMY